MSRPDGGPAFPTGGADWNQSTHSFDHAPLEGGMTLRDYFAAKAMSALSVDMDWSDDTIAATVGMAYRVADAMLAERAKGAA